MKGARLFILAVVGLWLAGGCQEGLSPRISIFGASPDFLLIVVSVLGLYCTRRSGSVLGFSAGFVQGALAGANLGSYVITRTLAGFLCASVSGLEIEPSPIVAGAMTALVTLAAQLGLMFISPPAVIVPFVLATIGSALVNGILAMPTQMLVKRLSDPYARRT